MINNNIIIEEFVLAIKKLHGLLEIKPIYIYKTESKSCVN
jgi:hypothetical protein